MSLKPIINVKNLDVSYFLGRQNEVNALQNINIKIYPGEFVVFFGPSGCGKSTLLYAIAGLETNIDGDIYFNDKNISDLDARQLEIFHQKNVGMIFQAYYLINSLSVLKNVILPQIAFKTTKKERTQKALNLLERFGVKEQMDKLPNELSGGQQQRVAVCRSLINEPDVLLADEPVGNLDSKSAEEVIGLLQDLNKKQKKTIILVTHDPSYLNIPHRVFYMKDGKIIKTRVNREIDGEIIHPKQEEIIKPSISKEFELLASAYGGISSSVDGNLLISFKAKQIVSEILTEMTVEEVSSIEKKVAKLLVEGINDVKGINAYLDEDVKKGGLGLDSRTAKKLTDKLQNITQEIKILQKQEVKVKRKESAIFDNRVLEIRSYLLKLFNIQLKNIKILLIFDSTINDRINNKIDKNVVRKFLDKSEDKGGVGLDKRVARKVARRLELLILGKYKNEQD